MSLIAAVADNGVIGSGNRLPWRLPADLRRFKALTLGHCLVMGRKTWESIGRALPGRRTVVLSRHAGYRLAGAAGAEVAASLDEALELAGAASAAPGPRGAGDASPAGDAEVFIAGGAEVYREALDRGLGERFWLTRVHHGFPGDTCFPAIDPAAWSLVSCERHEADSENPFAYSFLLYERRQGGQAAPGRESV